MNWVRNKKNVLLVILFFVTNIATAILVSNITEKGAEIDNFYQYTQVPDIELSGGMLFYGNTYQGKVLRAKKEGEFAYGEINGFVAFNNLDDQPRNVRQYQTIKATDRFDNRGYQVFEVEDIIKMSYLSPSKIGDPTELYYVDDSQEKLRMTDGNGWVIEISKNTFNPRIISTDAQGDKSYLITNRSDFEDLMKKLYR